MFAHLAPTVLLLGAVMAQGTPSVVTFQSISSVPTTEGAFTIQTTAPGMATSACYENCIMEPCAPCGVTSEGSMGILPGETPIPSSLLSSGSSGSAVTSTPAATSPSSSSSGTPPAQQSTAAASPLLLHGDRTPLMLALAVSGSALVGATFVFF